MALKLLLGHLIFCSVYTVCGKTSIFQDDLELERQLKTMNKSPIRTFVTKEGETIDCIDGNKQLSLDHPLLKNHRVQRKPSAHIVNSPTSSPIGKLVAFGSREPCPAGTVPIPRVRKEDLLRARSPLNNPSPFVSMDNDVSSHHMVSILVDDLDTKYGVDAHLSVYNLTVVEDQFSGHRLHIENGPSDHVSAIFAGWAVYPSLNGDGLTRFITYWTGDGFRNGCFNILCPGFVQIHRTLTPNSPITPTSTYGGQQYEIRVHVEQDPDIAVGYWPKELFVNLGDGGKRVSWGGEGFSGKSKICPPLGSGHTPDGKYHHAAFFRQIYYMTGSNRNQTPLAVFERVDKSKVYGLKNDMYIPKEGFGYSFTYGGPGGTCD
ncbi:hypothetical protein ACJRO7_014827 [Eucalyptus globulus]|uniref:Neprosin PEP catalytic domain-containing protein n=1 Tax=Eucalyptus globulus TaxID=34317 RepID=A0ABD3L5B3_EUCGL